MHGPGPAAFRALSMRPLHVLTLTPFYPNKNDETSGYFVAEPLVEIAGCGISNSVIAVQPTHRGKVEPSSAAPPANWIRYFSLPSGIGLSTAGAFLFSRMLGSVRDLHRSHPIDVVHAHAPLPCGHAAMLLYEELSIPYVVSVHGLDAYSDIQVRGVAGKWCRRVSSSVFYRAKRVICISEHVRDRVLKRIPDLLNTSVVYNGVDPEIFCSGDQESSGPPIVLSVGNLIETKGHAILLRAIDLLRKQNVDVICEIVGTGSQRTALERMAINLGLSVRFLGRLGRRELAEAFRRCTLFALPSYFEGLGCVYLEAMASERVAIGCTGQGIEEIIRHRVNGWLVEPKNMEDLALAISSLVSDQVLRKTLAKRGRQTIIEGLTISHQAKRLQMIYQETAG
jgi:teichuronic acid biosynthesis glycosyltransferase TuaC